MWESISKTAERIEQTPIRRALMLALFFSGSAGLINQVVWQRALKVFLGGSETISSMIVVLVFLAGLGVGSVWMGTRIGRVTAPARWFAGIELSLAVAGYGICQALGMDSSESIYYFQRAATGLGIPLRAVHASGAFVLLAVPCFLMGTTLPVAAEVCQRELGLRERGSVSKLYTANTLGAVFGSAIGAAILVPIWGQRLALMTAASANLAAAVIAFLAARAIGATPGAAPRKRELPNALDDERIPGFAVLAFGFGFCALWYEMFLYRAIALRHEPLPLIFSAVLTGFLVFWSLGVYASSLRASTTLFSRLTRAVVWTAISVAGALWFCVVDRTPTPLFTISNLIVFLLVKSIYFVPAFFFGLLFGSTIERAIRSWGRDVGWFAAWNTAGSCCGILLATFAGYEVDLLWMLLVLVLLLLGIGGVAGKLERARSLESPAPMSGDTVMFWLRNAKTVVFGLLALSTFATGFVQSPVARADGSIRLFGRDGVVVIDNAGYLFSDGLLQSRLSSDDNHIGSANWALAVDPVLAHPTGVIRTALVVGLGTGITAATLAKHDSIESVDVYDINQTLKRVLERFPDGTLRVAENPKVNIHWQDGRTGLAIREKKYDLISQQPLILKQAGASLLLSVEYFRLVSSRLEPDGVVAVFSNGTAEQALAVRQTASAVFPHMLALHQGYELILSRVPLDLSQHRVETLLRREGELWAEIRQLREAAGEGRWLEYIRTHQLPLGDSRITIRDDFPIIEYPHHLRTLVKGMHFAQALPRPRYDWQRP